MERIRRQEEVEMDPSEQPLFYYASSIADMLNSRDIVIEEAGSDFRQWEKQLKGRNKFNYNFSKKLGLLRINPENDIEALIIIPFVRHFPVEDSPENIKGLTIQDQTAKFDVLFPTGKTRLFAQSFAKKMGVNFDPSLLKQRSWLGQIVLYNYYNRHGKDVSFLAYVTNHPAMQKDHEALKNLIPSFAKLGVKNL